MAIQFRKLAVIRSYAMRSVTSADSIQVLAKHEDDSVLRGKTAKTIRSQTRYGTPLSSAFGFFHFFDEWRDNLEEIANHRDIGNLKDRSF